MFFPAFPIPDLILRALLLGPLALIWITVFVRMHGTRTFSKMTAFDFIATIATGSLLANAATSTEWAGFFQSSLGCSATLLVQGLLAKGMRKSGIVHDFMQNKPILLMRKGKFDREAMRSERVAEDDVWGKVREANAVRLEDIQGVVLETTGDISVLHGDSLDSEILESVRNKKLLKEIA